MMHVMERYFVTEDTLALTDGMAEALIRTVMEKDVYKRQPIISTRPERKSRWDTSPSYSNSRFSKIGRAHV